MGCTIFAPQEPWFGNEVEKNNLRWRLAETVAEPYEDWYFIIDADTFVVTALGLENALRETEYDVASIGFKEDVDGAWEQGLCGLRCLFRAIPGLRYDTNHFTYRLPDGRNLHDDPECLDLLTKVEVEHRTLWRDPYRKQKQTKYYERRDELRVEYPKEPIAQET